MRVISELSKKKLPSFALHMNIIGLQLFQNTSIRNSCSYTRLAGLVRLDGDSEEYTQIALSNVQLFFLLFMRNF